MTAEVKQEIDTIVKVIADTGLVSKIILFGSMARGDDNPGSDIDLCVLTPVKDRRPLDMSINFRMAVRKLQKSPLDLITYNNERFLYQSERPRTFENIIKNEGVTLYERQPQCKRVD
jgi:predicted nucleotidyltransferase